MPAQGLFSNIRLVEEQPKIELGPEQDLVDKSSQENADKNNYDDKGNLISIEHPDGSITIGNGLFPESYTEKTKSFPVQDFGICVTLIPPK